MAKAVPLEDTVQYSIYPVPACTDLGQAIALRTEILALVSDDVLRYLWHCERFRVSVAQDRDKDYVLSGRLTYRDNVEDEWYVIGLLMRISAHFADRVVIRVTDADGEILLIESAESIPSWAQEPDLAEGRAWLFNGRVHLIPVAKSPAQITPLPAGAITNPAAAAQIVARYSEVTRASDAVQECIEERVRTSSDWSEHRHVAHVYLPRKAAALLHNHPQLLAQAVQYLECRDHKDLRHVRSMSHFPQTDVALVPLVFTKHLFAHLYSEKLLPYKKSGWLLPPLAEEQHKSHAHGYRICAGLEILITRALEKQAETSDSHPCLTPAQLHSLRQVGYFKDFLPGSNAYEALLAKAATYFADTNSSPSSEPWEYLTETVRALDNLDNYVETYTAPNNLPTAGDESWLQVSKSSFDAMLEHHFRVDSRKAVPGAVQAFLESTSDMKGIEERGLDHAKLDQPLDVSAKSLQDAFQALLRLTEGNANPAEGDEFSSEDDEDCDLDEAYLKAMHEELKQSKVFQESDGASLEENLVQNLLSSVQNQTEENGPTNTLMTSVINSSMTK